MTTITKKFSVYIHFPFCVKKCRYCDFYSESNSLDLIKSFFFAVKKEWELVKNLYSLSESNIETIYCGGGTPSILSSDQWQNFLPLFFGELLPFSNIECSLECNPESFTEKKAYSWHKSGITRITIGVQSLNRRELAILGRSHGRDGALKILESCVLGLFESVGVDIMYGIPGQTRASLYDTVNTILSYKTINHLSAYELTIADNTPFGKHKRILPLPSEDEIAFMDEVIVNTTKNYGLYKYEISNYAKQGCQSKHNNAYWTHAPYIGLGPSAHSFMHFKRYSNVLDINEYINKLSNDILPVSFEEKITKEMLEREIIFLSLRTIRGLNEIDFFNKTGKVFNSGSRKQKLCKLIKAGKLLYEESHWFLTYEGLLYADNISQQLFSE